MWKINKMFEVTPWPVVFVKIAQQSWFSFIISEMSGTGEEPVRNWNWENYQELVLFMHLKINSLIAL